MGVPAMSFLRPHEELVEIPAETVQARVVSRILAHVSLGLAITIAVVNMGTPLFCHFSLAVLLAIIASAIVLKNTSIWTAEDYCCNVMRAYPTCCTKMCGNYPRNCCCARISSLLIATAVLSFLSIISGWFVEIAMAVHAYCHSHYYIGHHNGTMVTNSTRELPHHGFDWQYFPSIFLLIALGAVLSAAAVFVRKLEFALPDLRLPQNNMMVVRVRKAASTPLVGVVVKSEEC